MNTKASNFPDVFQAAEIVFDITSANGGGTFFHDRGEWRVYHGDGYAVGGYQDTVKVDLSDGNGEPVNAIASFIQRIPSDAKGWKHYYLGTWIDNDILYIDAVRIWADKEPADREALKNGEIAIYCLHTGETFERQDDGRYLVNHPEELETLPEIEPEEVVTVAALEELVEKLEAAATANIRLGATCSDDAYTVNEDGTITTDHASVRLSRSFDGRASGINHAIEAIRDLIHASK